MNQKTFGFIGGGRITRILLSGWERKNKLPDRIVVSDPNQKTLQELKERFPQIETTQDNYLAAEQEILFISLHPPVMADLMTELKNRLLPSTILISLAPKISIDKLTAMLGGFNRITRIIPNAPSIVNQGYNPVVFSPALTSQERDYLMNLFNLLGTTPEVNEEKLEAYAILTAMGPTYLWFQLYQLIDMGKSFGLNETELRAGLKGMTEGMIKTITDSGLEPHEVMDLVPVKPLVEEEENIKEMYRTKLSSLYQKLKS